MENPLVSVTIPTRNSGSTLEACLASVRSQTYRNVEVIVIDSNSSDNTLEIAKKHGAKVITTDWKLLGARYLGAKASIGEYVLLLDSDQILYNETIERSVQAMANYDMICFEEAAFQPRTLLEKLFDADRKFVQQLPELHFDPLEGVMLARFYRASVLQEAFQKIPIDRLHDVVAHDHAIIYYEAYRQTSKVGFLSQAVLHDEPSSLVELWRKNYRYGRTTKELLKSNLYVELLKRKTRLRKGASISSLWFQSTLLLFLKGVPYFIGLYL